MNDDDFEKKLKALMGAVRRPDPTPAWKSDILGRARREAEMIPLKQLLPPRALAITWAVAWAAIVVLSVTTPRKEERGAEMGGMASVAKPGEVATAFITSNSMLIAFGQRTDLDGDFR